MATPEYLTPGDLEANIGAGEVTRLSDDDGDGIRDSTTLNQVMAEAEGLAASYLLRGFSAQQILLLAANDPYLTSSSAWIACELLSERRGEFIAPDGKGRYWVQYERAIGYCDRLAKAQIKSKGEAVAGENKLAGGSVRPKTLDGKNPTFVFSPDRESPTGRSEEHTSELQSPTNLVC